MDSLYCNVSLVLIFDLKHKKTSREGGFFIIIVNLTDTGV
jgi:hypothetical protein